MIPVWLIWDDENYRDGVDITPEIFYSRLKTSKTLPSSSQPSVMEFEQLFEEVSKEVEAIVAVLVSSKMRGTVASAQSAANELPNLSIEIVDSLAGSMCLGLTVLAAARAAAAGDSLEQVVAAAEQMKEASIVEIDCQEDCDKLEIMVRDRFAPADIYRTGVSPVVGTIVGPGSIGLAYHTQN